MKKPEILKGISRQQVGRDSETMAVAYLKKRGYKILETNYHNALGEIDIVAKDRKTLVFVEVKARRSSRFGPPKEAVTIKKQKKISMVALYYLKETRQVGARARFDVVAIQHEGDQADINLIKNAFELAYA